MIACLIAASFCIVGKANAWTAGGTVWESENNGSDVIKGTLPVSWVPLLYTSGYDTSRTNFYFSDAKIAQCAAIDCTTYGYLGTGIPMYLQQEIAQGGYSGYFINGFLSAGQPMSAVGNPYGYMTIEGAFTSVPSEAPTSTRIQVGCGCEGTGGSAGYLVNVGSNVWSSWYSGNTPEEWYPDFGSQLLVNLQPFSSSTEMGYSIPTSESFCLSTSTSIYAGIKEAFCTLGFMLFVPSNASIESITSQRDRLMTQFPANIFASIQTALTVSSIQNATTTPTSTNLSIPLTFSSSTFMPTGSTTSVEMFGSTVYEKWVPAWVRSLFRMVISFSLWWAALSSTYVLAKRLFHPSGEK